MFRTCFVSGDRPLLNQARQEIIENSGQPMLLFDYSDQGMCFIAFFEKKGIGKMRLSMEYYHEIEKKYLSQIKFHSKDTFMKVDMEWAGKILFKNHNKFN